MMKSTKCPRCGRMLCDSDTELCPECETARVNELDAIRSYPPLPHALREYEIYDRTGGNKYGTRVGEAFRQEDGGPPLALVRADVLLPMLVHLRKFFHSVQRTDRDRPSRFVSPDEFMMSITTRGFTPEDFNGLMSLANSMSAEMAEALDAVRMPQMKRTIPDEHKRSIAKAEEVRLLSEMKAYNIPVEGDVAQNALDAAREEAEEVK